MGTMQYGTYTWFGYDLPFAEELRLIRDAGFDSVCTWWGDLGPIRREDQLALVERAGLRLEHAHLPYFGCNAIWFDGADGDALIAQHIEGAHIAASCGPKTLVVHPYDGVVPPAGNLHAAQRRLQRLADACASLGVRLAVENLGDNVALRGLLDALIDNPFVGLCFDTGHANYTAHNDFSLLQEYGGRLFALHLHDNNTVKDQHLLPFEGNLDWAQFYRLLKQTGFGGSLMLEACFPIDYAAAHDNPAYVFPDPEEPAPSFLRRAHRALKRVETGTPL